MVLATGLKLLAVEAEVTTDVSVAAGNQGVGVGPPAGKPVVLDHGEQQHRRSCDAMAAMPMGDLDAGTP